MLEDTCLPHLPFLLSPKMLTCPQCGTTSITNPRLQLLYSSCCGHCLCSDCIHSLFASHSSTTYSSTATNRCPACATPLTPRDFDPAPLSTQRYTKEVKFRARLNKLLSCLRRADFVDEFEWEQWKEWREDVVWLVVEGGKEDEKEGEKRIDEWRKENKDKLDKAMAREREEERRAQLTAEGKVSCKPLTATCIVARQDTSRSLMGRSFAAAVVTMLFCVVRSVSKLDEEVVDMTEVSNLYEPSSPHSINQQLSHHSHCTARH